MKILFYSVLFLLPFFSYSQSVNDSLIKQLFNKVLESEFKNPLEISVIDDESGFIIVKTNLDTSGLLKKVEPYIIKYFPFETSVQKMCKMPYKKNIGRIIYEIKDSIIGTDTVDFYISGENIVKLSLFISVTESVVKNVPDYRFIYNRKDKIWQQATIKEVNNIELVE